MKTNNLIELKSVDCYLDKDKGIIYPINKNNTPDFNCEISLFKDEVSLEWITSLSKEDIKECYPFLEGNNLTNPNKDKYFLNTNL